MKRYFLFGLIFILMMALLVGCGTGDKGRDSASGTEISANGESGELDYQEPEDLETPEETEGQETQPESEEPVDKYQTTEVPQGKPDPIEPQDTKVDKKTEYHATLSISCNTILDNMDLFDQAKLEVLPEDGVIYTTKEITFYEGESVFEVLLRETRDSKTHMEFVSTPIYNSNYIEGINNIYEFDCGELSGWMYRVNDWFPNYGCSRYLLEDGDKIEWVYTCDLGRDVGGDWTQQNQEQEKEQ